MGCMGSLFDIQLMQPSWLFAFTFFSVVLALVLIVLYRRHRTEASPGTVRAMLVVGVLLVANIAVGIYVYADYHKVMNYESLVYVVTLESPSNMEESIVLPGFDVAGTGDELDLVSGNARSEDVDTNKGHGVRVYFSGRARLEGEFLARKGWTEDPVPMVDRGEERTAHFWIYYEPSGDHNCSVDLHMTRSHLGTGSVWGFEGQVHVGWDDYEGSIKDWT